MNHLVKIKLTSNQNFFCPACSRLFSDHDSSELIECALKLCNWEEVADLACGVDEQLIQKPARSYPKEDSS